jgi:preprotein translocase subunit SecY
MTIFALGIMPYISASIILQLLTVVWPRLERIAKEGEAGRKKINQWTRYGTVLLSGFQGFGLGVFLRNRDLAAGVVADFPMLFLMTTAITMTAGTCFLMWLGEKITDHGIGNGISLIIAISILVSYPLAIGSGWTNANNQDAWLGFIGVLALTVVISGLIVLTQEASRKIPVQHARRMVGRKMMQGGGATHLPLKLNTAGVIPVIFSSAILSFPSFFQSFLPDPYGQNMSELLNPSSRYNLYNMMNLEAGKAFNILKVINLYSIAYAILTAFFCYFYTAITFNPVDLADNLKKGGAFIPGRKPGKHTSDFINYTLVRITVVGATALIVIALVPNVLSVCFGIDFNFAQIAGGTGLIIIVGVFLETMKQIEAQLMMRHYEGFKYRGVGAGGGRRVRR